MTKPYYEKDNSSIHKSLACNGLRHNNNNSHHNGPKHCLPWHTVSDYIMKRSRALATDDHILKPFQISTFLVSLISQSHTIHAYPNV